MHPLQIDTRGERESSASRSRLIEAALTQHAKRAREKGHRIDESDSLPPTPFIILFRFLLQRWTIFSMIGSLMLF